MEYLDGVHDLPRSNGTARLSRPAWPNSVEWSVVPTLSLCLNLPSLEMMLDHDDEGYTVVYGLVGPYLTRLLSSSLSILLDSTLSPLPLLLPSFTFNHTSTYTPLVSVEDPPSTPPLDFPSGKLIFLSPCTPAPPHQLRCTTYPQSDAD